MGFCLPKIALVIILCRFWVIVTLRPLVMRLKTIPEASDHGTVFKLCSIGIDLYAVSGRRARLLSKVWPSEGKPSLHNGDLNRHGYQEERTPIVSMSCASGGNQSTRTVRHARQSLLGMSTGGIRTFQTEAHSSKVA